MKNESWKKHIESLEEKGNASKFWRLAKTMMNNPSYSTTHQSPIEKPDGSFAVNSSEKVFANYFSEYEPPTQCPPKII